MRSNDGSLSQISVADACRAGYESKAALLDELRLRSDGQVYRIELGALRPDPRIALREAAVTTCADLKMLRSRLGRLDARASDGAWTFRTLEALAAHPGVRAAEVCRLVGQNKERFKINVRKLKNLGLTESLEIGYRLSARGEVLLRLMHAEIIGDAT